MVPTSTMLSPSNYFLQVPAHKLILTVMTRILYCHYFGFDLRLLRYLPRNNGANSGRLKLPKPSGDPFPLEMIPRKFDAKQKWRKCYEIL
jgi:hypothetical protein